MDFHELTISDVQKLTPDAVAITFDLPKGLEDEFSYQPGQYLTIRHMHEGEELRRSYSIASAPGEPLVIGVKRIEGGVFSNFAQGLKAGDVLEVAPPEGRFTLGSGRELLLVAAGSGITPVISIAAHALAEGRNATLIFGNRDSRHIMFREKLEALKDKHLANFTLIHVLSREEQDVPLLNGRIDGEKIARLAGAGVIDPARLEDAYLCGPGAMIDDVAEALEKLGLEKNRIHHERFLAEGEAPVVRSRQAQEAAQAGVEVEVILDGAHRRFTLTEEDETVLAAAARNGLELPYSCKGGMCCTCRCRIREGEAEMALNYSLEPWELEAGYTLACQTRPRSKKLVLDFDAA